MPRRPGGYCLSRSAWSRPIAVAGVLLAAALMTTGCAAGTAAPPPTAVPDAALPVGSTGWQITRPGAEHAIEGYADRVSVLPGEPVRLFVSTSALAFTVTAYRMGAYQGSDAAQVWRSGSLPGARQAPPGGRGPTNTVLAPGQPSLTGDTAGWGPGDYLFRLDAGDSRRGQTIGPLTVRQPAHA